MLVNKKIEDYKNQKIYIPQELNNYNYRYFLNNNNIQILTNNNCYTNYNTTYCDCYLYSQELNISTNSYSCSINYNATNSIDYSKITSDLENNLNITNQYINLNIMQLIMIILGILFALFITKERKFY